MENESAWEAIIGFESRYYFDKFLYWMDQQIKNGHCREIEVKSKYGNASFEEKWYLQSCGHIWRLVWPDPPCRGAFKLVSEAELKAGFWVNEE